MVQSHKSVTVIYYNNTQKNKNHRLSHRCRKLLTDSRSIYDKNSQQHGYRGKEESIACVLRCVPLFVTVWTVANHAHLSMGFSRQEYWSGLSFPSPGYLPNPGIKPEFSASPALKTDSLLLEPSGKPPDLTYPSYYTLY